MKSGDIRTIIEAVSIAKKEGVSWECIDSFLDSFPSNFGPQLKLRIKNKIYGKEMCDALPTRQS